MTVQFVWREGIQFARLSKLLYDYFSIAGYSFWGMIGFPDQPPGRFCITRYLSEPSFEPPHGPWEGLPGYKVKYQTEFVDCPWQDDPWRKPRTDLIQWTVLPLGASNGPWGSFYVRMEHNLRYSHGRFPTKVHHLSLGLDGDFCRPYGDGDTSFAALFPKYHQLKELFAVLECDEVFEEGISPCDQVRQRYPHHRNMTFRFAKEGTQVLVKSMEEAFVVLGLSWEDARIFIDPPGVHGLSPRECMEAEEQREREDERRRVAAHKQHSQKKGVSQ